MNPVRDEAATTLRYQEGTTVSDDAATTECRLCGSSFAAEAVLLDPLPAGRMATRASSAGRADRHQVRHRVPVPRKGRRAATIHNS